MSTVSVIRQAVIQEINRIPFDGIGGSVKIDDDFEPIQSNTTLDCTFVDGGNMTILHTPYCHLEMNRLFGATYNGMSRIREYPRVSFYSLIRYEPITHSIYPIRREESVYLVSERMLNDASALIHAPQTHRHDSMARSYSEWTYATKVIRDMECSKDRLNILVMDGALNAWGGKESQLMSELCHTAHRRGVVVCALAKTTNAMYNGRPLISHLRNMHSHGPAFVRIGHMRDAAATLGVVLHERSRPYLLDIEQAAYDTLDRQDIHDIVNTIRANSQDVRMYGYPTGLIRADHMAKIRKDEGRIVSWEIRHSLSKDIQRDIADMEMHEKLNEVNR